MGAGSPATVSASALEAPGALQAEPKSHPRLASEPVVHPDLRLAELLRQHYARVWRALRRFGVDASSADDAAQEAFIVLSRRLDEVRAGCEQTFLLGCAVRIASNHRRRSHATREVEDEHTLGVAPDPRPSAEQLLDHKQLREALDELLDSWPDDIRVAFVLFELEGLSVPEIARVTETKLGTVASRLRRARELFQAGAKRLRARADGGGR
jgi:RNA polymerase sigma-70 factor, ECF subfamily